MRIVLLVEGDSEKHLDKFMQRFIDQRAPFPIEVQTVNMGGKDKYLSEIAARTERHLSEKETLAVVGLLDIHEFERNLKDFRYAALTPLKEKISLARNYVIKKISEPYKQRFYQHFAVHEFEAYLLSAPELFTKIDITDLSDDPESVNFKSPPSKRLIERYNAIGRDYRKHIMARFLLPQLDPTIVYQKCPHFRAMIDEMLSIIQNTTY